MLVGIITVNTLTRQYSLEKMATREPQGKPTDMRVSGTSLGLKSHEEAYGKMKTHGAVAGAALDDSSALDQMMIINRKLVTQIETLRLKIDVDARQHERSKAGLLATTDTKIKTRELEISHLQSQLRERDDQLNDLSEENDKKTAELHSMQAQLDELKEDVTVSKTYADDVQAQLVQLRFEQTGLNSNEEYRKKEEVIQKLQDEVDSLKQNLQTLEDELRRAKDAIAKQRGQIRWLESDRKSSESSFKEELAKMSQIMRHEIERMRDVMKQQWKEMKELREQNECMRNDVRSIRDLLAEQAQAESSPHPSHRYPISPFNLYPESPTSLPPVYKSNSKQNSPGKNKRK